MQKMDTTIRIPFINDLKICEKCNKIYTSRDIIPLCPDCRYEESKFQV